MDQHFRTFPKIRAYLEGSSRAALDRGYAFTLAGRRIGSEVVNRVRLALAVLLLIPFLVLPNCPLTKGPFRCIVYL